eukprot:sb/3473444/
MDQDQIDQESLVVQLRTAFLKQNLEPYDSRDISRVRNDDRVVLAYLKNCRFNREKAFNMMCESLKWRKSFGVNDISKESFSAEVLMTPISTSRDTINRGSFTGCGLSNIDYDFIKYLISLLTEYYPDILDNLLVFEMPRLLSGTYTPCIVI